MPFISNPLRKIGFRKIPLEWHDICIIQARVDEKMVQRNFFLMEKTMRVRHLAVAMGAVALMLSTGAAFANPINLGGYTGPVQIKFNNLEAFTGGSLAVGADNYGIFQITSILVGGSGPNAGNIVYQAPITPSVNNPLLVGVFAGIHVAAINPVNSGGVVETTTNTGGSFAIYANTSSTFGAIGSQGAAGYSALGCTVDTLCYKGITNNGAALLTYNLVPGAIASAPSATLYSDISATSPLTGKANGFADITGGTDASQFTKGGFLTGAGTLADLSIQDNFCTTGSSGCSGTTNWPLSSQDPVLAAVPEPGSLLVLGSALVMFGLVGWRRQRRNDQHA